MIRSKHWWLITLKGLIFIFLGMYILKSPVLGMLGIIVYGGFMLLVSGLTIIAFAIYTRKVNHNWKWQMTEGFLDIILALILMFNIGLTVITLPYVFAFFGILTGICWLMESLYLKRSHYRYWLVALLAGIFSFLIGIIIFYRPVLAALTIFGIIGIMFTIQGLFFVLFSIQISKLKN